MRRLTVSELLTATGGTLLAGGVSAHADLSLIHI